ncbi:unnamed protein product [Brassica rapa]|uniref:Uncharacterized protein n=1 Tax=Brassica campestris TaxID=3711 RepID=A0A3P5Z582_BRACM|nr:unnamed protein product [Brassica rapa]VDC68250.1 unnamed protein product [Brassica rapa]
MEFKRLHMVILQWAEPWLSVQSLRDIGCHAACPVGINSSAQSRRKSAVIFSEEIHLQVDQVWKLNVKDARGKSWFKSVTVEDTHHELEFDVEEAVENISGASHVLYSQLGGAVRRDLLTSNSGLNRRLVHDGNIARGESNESTRGIRSLEMDIYQVWSWNFTVLRQFTVKKRDVRDGIRLSILGSLGFLFS